MLFTDREDAGRRLAERLASEHLTEPLVLALPRGGVPVAAVVADALGAPLQVFVARKVGAPGHPEYGIGAIAEGTDEVLVSEAADRLGLGTEDMAALAGRERAELDRRVEMYRGAEAIPPLEGRDVVLVDDGLATGVTAEAALASLRRRKPRRLLLAVPVCAGDSAQRLSGIADSVVCLAAPEGFRAVGLWYERFEQTTDQEVLALLRERRAGATEEPSAAGEREVAVEVPGVGPLQRLQGDLVVPAAAAGVVLFAHGSGSSRHSPRNRAVATALQRRGLATLLIDLLTPEEERLEARTRHLRFDIGLLAGRLALVTGWLAEDSATAALPLGYFGASTGAAAALVAAAEQPRRVRAVVSRGGRPDLAGPVLRGVVAPTLLIVGSRDQTVLALNTSAAAELGGDHRLEVVEGATHLFEEPGALEEVARLAGDWLTTWLSD
jgi:putative phosphoribosyl transferase